MEMKTVLLKISDKSYNDLLDLVECEYDIPKDKSKDIKDYLVQKLAKLGIECYDGFGHSDFYEWIADSTAKKFKLRRYENE